MKYFLVLVAALALTSLPAATVAYEHLPESVSNVVSFHTVGGPVVADDFDPAVGTGGWVVFAEWWGSVANSSSWEITFHQGGLSGGIGQPLAIPASTGGTKLFVDAGGTAVGGGLFYYAAAIPLGTFAVNGGPVPFGSEYWFSVANASSGWTWAFAGAGPTAGDDHWFGVQSFGSTPCGDGGPHCGAWNAINGRDFAFRLSTVPEPTTMALVGLGLLAFGGLRRLHGNKPGNRSAGCRQRRTAFRAGSAKTRLFAHSTMVRYTTSTSPT